MGRLRNVRLAGVLFGVMGACTATARGGEPVLADEPLARRMQPILSRCIECHGGEEPAGGLDLSTRQAALRGGESGAAIHPGDASRSLVYRKVASKKMPPKEPLGADDVALVRAWVESGARLG